MSFKLWQHQNQMLDHANSRKHSLIYAGMGTGKTLFALTWLRQFKGLTLVIAPKPALVAWRDDLAEFYPDQTALILEKGTSKQKIGFILEAWKANKPLIIIVNYETARLLPLARYPFEAVILDEGHRIGHYNSKQTLALTRMLADVPRKIIMTGTPYNDGYERLYSMVRFFHPKQPARNNAHPLCAVFGHYNDFLDNFCYTYELSRGVRVINGYKNLDHLAYDIETYTLQIKAADVLDLPAIVERVYTVPLMGPVKKAYRSLDKESAIDLSQFEGGPIRENAKVEMPNGDILLVSHLLTKIIRLQQLATCGLMVSDDGQEVIFGGIEKRLDTLKMLVDSIQEPLVIFTRFKRDVILIRNAIKENVHMLTGAADSHDEWRRGKGRILIANIGAGSEGVRLERAHHMIFWSVGYSNTQFEQAKARIIRAGQLSKTVWLHYIVSEDTIDETIYKTLNGKNEDKRRLDDLI